MKLFKFRGGIHPDGRKEVTTSKAIRVMPMPKKLYIPLQQHVGMAAEAEVKVGDKVLKGQLLAHSQGRISAPVHAPTSGTIVAIGDYCAPHPSALPVRTITLEADGADRWVNNVSQFDPLNMQPLEIAARVGAAGIVGLGGATFPSAVKLEQSIRNSIQTLIINGGECEPYLTCDDRLMQEKAEQIVDGVRIILYAIKAKNAFIAVEDNKPAALDALRRASESLASIQVVAVPAQYPMGSADHMVKTLTNLEVPSGGRSSDIGVLVHNVGTTYAIHRAVRHGQPLVSRVVTVGGGAMRECMNVEVPIGATLRDVVDFCGGFRETPARLVMGGPLMGQMMPHLDVPVVKGTSGILGLTAAEIADSQPSPCIRCGTCVSACPNGLMPFQMAAHAKVGNFDKVVEYGLVDCISCGCCAYVCPSHIPLVQYFNYARGEITAKQQLKHKIDENRKLIALKQERLDREKREREEAAARRKAEAAQKKAAAANKVVNDDE